MADIPVYEGLGETLVTITANGQSVVAFDFLAFSANQVKAEYRPASGAPFQLVLNTNYTVAGLNQPNGGTLTLTGFTRSVNDQVYIYRETPIEREKDWQNEGDYKADLVNREQDTMFMIMQELARGIDEGSAETDRLRGEVVLLPDGHAGDQKLPPPSPGRVIGYGAGGEFRALSNSAAEAEIAAEEAREARNESVVVRDQVLAAASAWSFLDTPRSLLEALSDPLLPTPYFIDGWTSGDFAGFNMGNPNGVSSRPTDSMLQPIVEFNVTGTVGAQSLTINSGDESTGQGAWAAIIQHDDNTYGAYMVTALGSGSCTIWPNLRATVTAKTMRNMGGSSNGQHYTEPGYKALAHRIFRATKADAYRVRYVDAWDAQTGDAWEPVNPLSPASIFVINNVIANAANRARWAFVSRSRRVSRGSGTVGRGQTRDFDLDGRSGMLEVFASRADITASGKFYNVRIMASVDGTPFHDQIYTENDGLVRVFVPFPAGSVGTVLIDPVDEAGGHTYADDTTWWVYDRLASPNSTTTWSTRAIDINAKTVVIGDSWTTFYPSVSGQPDGILGRELQSLMAAAGGSGQVVSVGQGGMTAEWGLANFDERVLPENPKQVLILFFTNDAVQYGTNGYARWLTAMFKIGRKCQMIGANPIYVMPLPTSSLGQSINHGIWASALGKGLPL